MSRKPLGSPILLGFRVLSQGVNQWRLPCNRQCGATRYQVVNSTERCQAAATVRKVAAIFQALAVIPRLQALFLFVWAFPGLRLPWIQVMDGGFGVLSQRMFTITVFAA